MHSYSKVVTELLELAALVHHKRFQVYITEARPSSTSALRVQKFCEYSRIPCHIILDSAVGYWMDKMDMVLFGAEGVVENGGIINQV